MKPEIENLKYWMSGISTTGYQRALAVREFEQLLSYVNELEQLRQPLVSGSLPIFKCKCGYETSDSVGWCVHADCCNGNHR